MKVLDNFLKECSKKLNLECIMQIGSSTYDKDADDIDLVLFFKDLVISEKDYMKLGELMNSMKGDRVSFDFSGSVKEKGKLNVTIVPLQIADIKWNVDIMFLKTIVEDKNKKILYGKNPLPNRLKISKDRLIDRFAIDLNHHLRLMVEKGIKDLPPIILSNLF